MGTKFIRALLDMAAKPPVYEKTIVEEKSEAELVREKLERGKALTGHEERVEFMARENTGSHPLDSGTMCGYRYNQPIREELIYYSCGHSINTVEWLKRVLETDEKSLDLQRDFEHFAETPEMRDEDWLTRMERWIAKREFEHAGTFNSYNWDSDLDQVIQGIPFGTDGAVPIESENCFVILQTHNGADVRGGYSKPRVFRVPDPHLFFEDRVEFYCSKCEKSWEDCYEFVRAGGKIDEKSGNALCPKGHAAVATNRAEDY